MPTVIACAALFVAMVPLTTMGQDAPVSEPRSATKTQYLACLIDRALIDKRTQTLQEHDKGLKELAVKFQAAEAHLAEQVRRHRPRTKKETESYNRAISARNKSADRFNEQGRSIQQEQHGLNGFIVETNAKCGGLLVSADVAAEAEQEFQVLSRPK